MPHAAPEETVRSVLAAAGAAGFSVSRSQLHRWQQRGLVPKPRARGLGRGLGTETLYPGGTAEQLVRLCELQQQIRALNEIAWVLWWERYPVAESLIRDLVRKQLEFAEHLRKEVQSQLVNGEEISPGRDLVKAFEDASRARPRGIVGTIRRRIGKKHFPTMLAFASQMVSGLTPDLESDEDARVVAKGFASVDLEGTRKTIRGAAEMLHPAELRRSFEAASFDDLCATRDEVREMLRIVATANQLVALGMGRVLESRFIAELTQPTPADGSHVVLLWLSLRQSNDMRALFDEFVPDPQSRQPQDTDPREEDRNDAHRDD